MHVVPLVLLSIAPLSLLNPTMWSRLWRNLIPKLVSLGPKPSQLTKPTMLALLMRTQIKLFSGLRKNLTKCSQQTLITLRMFNAWTHLCTETTPAIVQLGTREVTAPRKSIASPSVSSMWPSQLSIKAVRVPILIHMCSRSKVLTHVSPLTSINPCPSSIYLNAEISILRASWSTEQRASVFPTRIW